MGKTKAKKRSANPANNSVQQSANPELSSRDIELLSLLSDGKRNKEIAKVLKVSPRTVEAYRHKLQLKLGVSSFPELVRYAIRNGIVKA